MGVHVHDAVVEAVFAQAGDDATDVVLPRGWNADGGRRRSVVCGNAGPAEAVGVQASTQMERGPLLARPYCISVSFLVVVM